MDSNQFKQAAYAAIDEIVQYYDTIDDCRVVSTVEPGYLGKLLPQGPPENGEEWADIQKDISSKIMPGLTHWQSPNFMAFFPTASSYPAMLGELYSSAFTAAAFNWLCSPAMTELETIVLDWLAGLLALPKCFLSIGQGGGVIQGSASEAIVVVMVAARDRYLRNATEGLSVEQREDEIGRLRSKLVALGSAMTHSCTNKAAMITGVRYRSVPVETEDDFALRGSSLRRTIEQCKREELIPFFLTLNLGTTSTCAVDNFAEIADIADANPDLWVHVDAAWAGAALVCEEYQHHAVFLGHFDSFDINMHKWLLTNFDASCLFVKCRRHLIDALSITPAYLRNSFSESGFVTDYRDWQIPLGRRFRALKIWFVMRTYGVQGMKAYIRKGIGLGNLFASLVKGRGDLFEILAPPAFALTVFNVVARRSENPMDTNAGADANHRDLENENYIKAHPKNGANELTKQVYELVNSRGEIFITSTVIGDTYGIRVVSANVKADERHVRRAFDVLVATTEEILDKADKDLQANGAVECVADGSIKAEGRPSKSGKVNRIASVDDISSISSQPRSMSMKRKGEHATEVAGEAKRTKMD